MLFYFSVYLNIRCIYFFNNMAIFARIITFKTTKAPESMIRALLFEKIRISYFASLASFNANVVV